MSSSSEAITALGEDGSLAIGSWVYGAGGGVGGSIYPEAEFMDLATGSPAWVAELA